MATIRILATVGAALFAGLTLTLASATLAPAWAEPQTTAAAPAGRPLNLLPQLKKVKQFTRQARKPTRVARAKTTLRRTARNRATPAVRVFARRQSERAVAQREDVMVMPGPSLAYQAESKNPPTAEAWLRRPIAAASRAPAASPTPAPPPAPALAQASAADRDEVDTTDADTVQVADASEFNEIDLAASETLVASSETPAPTDKSWLHALLAVLGGAFAAAASARFLLA